jgi:signal transduction histidine kinase
LVHKGTGAPALADAANVLSDQLKTHLNRLAALLKPHLGRLDRAFEQRLRRLGWGPKQRITLAAITAGAAARIVARGHPLHDFLEQVEYSGRRLAKLNLPPSGIVQALAEYDRLAAPLIKELSPGEAMNLQWVREQLHFVVVLTLNRAYYRVREAEAETFYDLFRTELETHTLDDLLRGSLQVLASFCGAQEAHFFVLDGRGAAWTVKASIGGNGGPPPVAATPSLRQRLVRPRSFEAGSRSRTVLLDASWPRRFAWVWSVPLQSNGALTGVMQFGFSKRYDWLPREQELLLAASERCAAAVEKARLVEDLGARQRQIRRLAEHMLHVEEVERRRISRELHDETGQSLLYIRLELEMLEKELPDRWRQRLAQIREVAESAILETRRLIGALSPAVLEQLGLAAALRQLAARLRQRHPCRVRLHVSHLGRLPKTIETVAYRLVQECCHNIVKHSRAGNVNISVASADGLLRLSVEDDGIGFPVGEALVKNDTFGLAGMRERVTLLGGVLEIQSRGSPDGGARRRSGTRITALLPVPTEGNPKESDRGPSCAAARVPAKWMKTHG